MEPQIDRRRLLRAGGALALVAMVPACTSSSGGDNGNGASPDTSAGTASGEAPSLRALVDSGDLPPVAERLPADPAVVEPIEQIGSYGGTWRNGMVGAQSFRLDYAIGYEPLVRWNLAWDEVIPNVAASFEVSDDATQYTFTLREGMRWSDGAPFTADDILFAYDDLVANPDVMPDGLSLFMVDGELATLEKVDDTTVTFTFPGPHGLFLDALANQPINVLTRLPRHYLQKFHRDYSDDADQAAKDAGFSGWVEALQHAIGGAALWSDIELPRLHAWVPTTPISSATRMTFERNPYYWKVDPEGNQLPYLDGVEYSIVQDEEVLLLNTVQGEIDMIDRVVTTTANKPVLAADRETAGYEFFNLIPDKLNTVTILLNLTCKDEVKREIFQNRDFRIGLSHAINRQEIIDAVFARQGEPAQPAPLPESALYDEEFATQYTAYDVDLANQHLDAAGLTETDGDGIRLGPDGTPVSIRVLAPSDQKTELIDALELIKGYWRDVGVELTVQGEGSEHRYEILDASDQEAHVWDGDGGIHPVSTPQYYLPMDGLDNRFAAGWSTWLDTDGSGEGAIEPPDAAKEQLELYRQVQAEADPERRNELMRHVLQIAKEQFYLIGVSTPLPGYGVVKNEFRNMVDETYFAGGFPYPGATYPEQFYLDN
ncbi:ABC transporter substrate-binding protein [Phytoactinopolyspora halotolerans]|uniref:ABC transporter substrate-binding protein n=1 Tax=Phytoactinopolyspora halotolerans TaxID=1981512 RepID=A0A6L9SAJ6_9ACTN|nr:ABC transporter substrate-binding protein [Phytoactinopolyspora halotolerans]NEE01644.1 ABC transporter substrate-binding protein [Phytoactinopolyspora halotolerans]